jgi:signal peptidase I
LTILVIVIAWTIFAPLEVGGKVKYVIIDGTSMLPKFVNGDLVVVRQAPYYEVGDVVASSYPGIGTVIHRIVEKRNKFKVITILGLMVTHLRLMKSTESFGFTFQVLVKLS